MSKIGEYLNALTIITHRLGNLPMAEAYCTKIYNSGKNPGIFLHLIKTYLYPPEARVQQSLRVQWFMRINDL